MTLKPVRQSSGGWLHVLFADDDPGMRAIVTMNLNSDGFEVTAVEDGDTALSAAEHLYPDLIVLDVMMPGRDGLEGLRSLKSHPDTATTPVVLLTAKATERDVQDGWEAGADFYMTKPFKPEDLAHLAHQVFGTGEMC
jgi:DNA-binding response OmpR family regulator